MIRPSKVGTTRRRTEGSVRVPSDGDPRRGLLRQGHAELVQQKLVLLVGSGVSLLPGNMFTRRLERTRGDPGKFADCASRLFGAMPAGGDAGSEPVA